MKNLFFSVIFFFVIVSFVQAEVNVTFNVYNATIENGNVIKGNSAVNNFEVIGYVCTNSDCTSIGNQVNYLSGNSNSNSIKLTFPTNLIGQGYLLYFYKDGYIGHEEKKITYSGAGEITYPKNIFLYKKNVGIAEIKNINGIKTNISNGTILNLNYKIVADGNSLDAILDSRSANYPLEESTKINSWFLVRNDSGIVHQEKESNHLEYSGELFNSFNYQFNNSGIYNITIISEIIDDKIFNPTNSTFSFLTNVYLENSSNSSNENNQTNQTENSSEQFYGFSNLTFLNYSNYSSNYTFNFNQSSTKINQSGSFSIPSNLTIKIVKDNSSLIYTENRNLTNNENLFNFNYNFTQIGNYSINFLVCPILSSNFSCSEKNLYLEIKNDSSKLDDDDEDDDDKSSCKSCKKKSNSIGYLDTETKKKINLNYEEEESSKTIELNFTSEECADGEIIYYWILFLLILCLVIISVIILYILKEPL